MYFCQSAEQLGSFFYTETGCTVEQSREYVEIVVGPFGAIYYGSAFHSQTSAVIGYFFMCFDRAYGHIELDIDRIAAFPFAVYDEVSRFQFAADRSSVYLDGVGRSQTVGITVEIAWHGTVEHPPRDAYVQRHYGIAFVDFQAYVAIPWIACFLRDGELFAAERDFRLVRHEQVDVQIVVPDSIYVTGK